VRTPEERAAIYEDALREIMEEVKGDSDWDSVDGYGFVPANREARVWRMAAGAIATVRGGDPRNPGQRGGTVSVEWPDTETVLACDHCGEVRPVRLEVSPYLEEIWPDDENEPSWWCYQCYQDDADEI
jgi:hypothetical protein